MDLHDSHDGFLSLLWRIGSGGDALFFFGGSRAIVCLKGVEVAAEKDFADAGVWITRGYFVQLVKKEKKQRRKQ